MGISSSNNSSNNAQRSSPSPSSNPNLNTSTVMPMEILIPEDNTSVEMESSISNSNSNGNSNSNHNSKDTEPFSGSSSSNPNPKPNPNPNAATLTATEILTLEEETTATMLKNIEKLAPELIQDILSRLPVHSLFQCKQVCPSWRSLFHHPDHQLAKLHYRRSIQNQSQNPVDPTSLIIFSDSRSRLGTSMFPDHLHYIHNIDTCEEAIEGKALPFESSLSGLGLVGSCNGFLCLTDVIDVNRSDPTLILCNPVIGDWVKLPPFPGEYSVIHFGFGYVPKTNEYKVVRMHSSNSPMEVSILTLGGNTWRSIGTTTSGIISDHMFGVHVNGVLHWLTFDDALHAEGIKTFNLDDETFGVLSLPAAIRGKCFSFVSPQFYLGVLGGCLMLVNHMQERLQQVWLMKDFGNKSWILEFTIPKPPQSAGRPDIRPLKMRKDGIIILECGERLYSYDPIARTHELLEVPGLLYYFTAYPHLGTLVTVRDVIAMEESFAMTEEQGDVPAAAGYDDNDDDEDSDETESSVDGEEDGTEEQLSVTAADDD